MTAIPLCAILVLKRVPGFSFLATILPSAEHTVISLTASELLMKSVPPLTRMSTPSPSCAVVLSMPSVTVPPARRNSMYVHDALRCASGMRSVVVASSPTFSISTVAAMRCPTGGSLLPSALHGMAASTVYDCSPDVTFMFIMDASVSFQLPSSPCQALHTASRRNEKQYMPSCGEVDDTLSASIMSLTLSVVPLLLTNVGSAVRAMK
ncbi:unknown [Prevotella sp. CAG:487]|nr:unknown [Prevotella sp. CAG:487]